MSKYNVGDLVWIPDGTITYVDQMLIGIPVNGPLYGLVLKILNEDNYLLVKVGNRNHTVAEKYVRNINKEEKAYGQINRSCANP